MWAFAPKFLCSHPPSYAHAFRCGPECMSLWMECTWAYVWLVPVNTCETSPGSAARGRVVADGLHSRYTRIDTHTHTQTTDTIRSKCGYEPDAISK